MKYKVGDRVLVGGHYHELTWLSGRVSAVIEGKVHVESDEPHCESPYGCRPEYRHWVRHEDSLELRRIS
jgi:hypothetical protein